MILIEPKLGKEELERVAGHLAKIYRQADRLMTARASSAEPMRALTLQELTSQPIRSRLESVDDGVSGLEYAAWSIGHTLLATAGSDALHLVFGMFEEIETSPRASSWLDHRWSGVSDGAYVWTA
jgi:hypothetical protein